MERCFWFSLIFLGVFGTVSVYSWISRGNPEGSFQWENFSNPDDFIAYCKQRVPPQVEIENSYNWTEKSSELWTEAENLKNSQQNEFQKRLREYNEIEMDIEKIKKLYATYSGLVTSLQTIEASKKSLKKAYLQSLRDIDTTILLKNCENIDVTNSLTQELRELEEEIGYFVKEHVEEIAGWWVSSQTTIEKGRLLQDIITSTNGMRLENYPSDPIVYSRSLDRQKSKRFCTIKALSVFPNLLVDNQPLYKISKKRESNMTCQECQIVSLDIVNLDDWGLEEQKRQDLEYLISNIKNHNKIQENHLGDLDKTYNHQIMELEDQLEDQINRYKAQQSLIQEEVIKLSRKEIYRETIPSSFPFSWENYTEIFQNISLRLDGMRKDEEKELNKIFKGTGKIVYTLKRVIIPEDKKAPEYFLELIDPQNERSYFWELLKRLEELWQIELTVVENGRLKSIKGNEFYYKPSLNSIRQFALIGPDFRWEGEYRTVTFILALKGILQKIECPQDIFTAENYSKAADKCSPCQLPTIISLIKRQDLPDGEYWT